jgi:hypothetical protein
MSHSVVFDQDMHCIRVVMEGPITVPSVSAAITDAISLSDKHECNRFFYDLRKARLRMSNGELYWFPREFTDFLRHIISVLVDPKDDMKKWKFVEDLDTNIAIKIRIFTEEQEAISWLLSFDRPTES